MGRLIIIILAFTVVKAGAQKIEGRVVDSSTKAPLCYASINIGHQQKLLYTDSSGNFSLNRDSADAGDSIYVQYIGYRKLVIPIKKLGAVNILPMVQDGAELTPVAITNCRKFKEYTVNRNVGKINEYVGPGPETKFVIIGRYIYGKDARGYIKQLEMYAGNFNINIHVPVRLHWYAWDSLNNLPGKELTSSSIIFYLGRQGWNNFTLPVNTVYFSGGIVLGLEFIYPVEYMRQYNLLQTVDEKAAWLMDMKNRWSLGIQTTKDAAQTGFYQVNNLPVKSYNSRGRGLFIKPAIRFTLDKCVE